MRLTVPKPKVKYVLDKRYKNKSGTYVVKLEVYYRGYRRYIKTHLKLTPEEYERIKTGDARGALLDYKFQLNKELVRAQEVLKTMQNFNFEEYKKLLGIHGAMRDLPWYFDLYYQELIAKKRMQTAAHYKTAKNILSSYFKGKFNFYSITPQLLEEFEEHYYRLGRSMGTVGNYMRALRAVYNRAKRDYVISEMDYPFGKDKYIVPSVRKRKVGVPLDIVQEIHRHPLEKPFDQFNREMWIFSFHCNGLNMKDIAYLKYGDLKNRKLTVIRAKTRYTRKRQQRPILIHLNKHAMAIIEKWGTKPAKDTNYIFPILNHEMTDEQLYKRYKQTTQNTRKLIQRIAEEKGWEFKINFQSARHSFGNRLQKSNEPLHVAQEAMGHSDPKITLHYFQDLDEEKQEYISTLTDYEL